MDLVTESQKAFRRISQSGNIVLFLLWHIVHLIRVKYLGIVIDSDEARNTSKVVELLEWLSAIGVKKVCLYDREGVLKKSKAVFIEKFGTTEIPSENSVADPPSKNPMDFEFVSLSDGKEAVAKASNLLYKKYYVDEDSEKPFFTETHLTEALKTLGAVEPDPDLLLIYGPVRCHLGFPAWRIRYTEMVHMGPLKYKKLGLIRKAIHRFTKVKQNYGS